MFGTHAFAISYVIRTPTTTGPGALSSLLLYSNGSAWGNTGTFVPVSGAAATTIYKMGFSISNTSSNQALWTDSQWYREQMPDNGASVTPNSLFYSAYGNNWYVSLSEVLTNPAPGQARLAITINITNYSISAQTFETYWFVDPDVMHITASATDDGVERIANTYASGYGLAIGQQSVTGSVEPNYAVRLEASTPVTFFGISTTGGGSDYWDAAGEHHADGLGIIWPGIDLQHRNKIENEGPDVNFASDSGRDCAGVLMCDMGAIGWNASKSMTFYLTWGVAGTPVGLSHFSVE